MASGEASSVLPNSAERELPANVPPAITADKQSVDGSNPSGGVNHSKGVSAKAEPLVS